MRKLFNVPARLLLLALPFALLPGMSWGAAIQSSDLPEPTVRLNNQDGTLVINISYRIPFSPREAWAVLTDFEGMPGFIPNLETSKVLLRTGKIIQVEQRGSISLGMLPIHYESKRQIELVPYQSIRSHSLSGNTRIDSVMVLTPSGNGTLLAYHATAIPDLPVPSSLISSYMGEMLENQFKAMGQEMVRRAQPDDADENDDNDTQAAQLAGQPAAQKTSQQAVKPVAGKSPLPQAKPAPKKARVLTKKRPG